MVVVVMVLIVNINCLFLFVYGNVYILYILYTVCIEFKRSSRWERARYPATLPGTKHTLLHSLDVYFVFILYTILTLYYILYTMQEGYDHSYFFISTFIDEHVEFHAKRLLA